MPINEDYLEAYAEIYLCLIRYLRYQLHNKVCEVKMGLDFSKVTRSRVTDFSDCKISEVHFIADS